MADSVDRVFSHALNTVNKIRTGSQKPPSGTRLRLYGLYKQAMEGDVDGIMARPDGGSEPDARAREKWDAWKQQNGLSRTEAKRRYITTLIDTMHRFASPEPDSRELVAELEFVWDQVKSNVPSSSSSSPLQTLDHAPGMAASYSALERRRGGKEEDDVDDDDDDDDPPLQIKSPMSQSEEDLEAREAAIDADADRDEFVDAPDSQYALALYRQGAMDHDLSSAPPRPAHARRTIAAILPPSQTTPTPASRLRHIPPQPIPYPRPDPQSAPQPAKDSPAELKHRHRIEAALVKLTAEVAALREQLEARRLFTHRPHTRFLRALGRLAWAGVKLLALDALLVLLVLAVLRARGDRRMEGVVRGLLGGAVARVRGVARVPVLGVLGVGKRGKAGEG